MTTPAPTPDPAPAVLDDDDQWYDVATLIWETIFDWPLVALILGLIALKVYDEIKVKHGDTEVGGKKSKGLEGWIIVERDVVVDDIWSDDEPDEPR